MVTPASGVCAAPPPASVAAAPSMPAGSGAALPSDAPTDRSPRFATRRPLSRDPADAVARIITAGLLLGLAWRLGANFLETGRPTGLLLLVSESLVVVLTVLRRHASAIDRRLVARLVAAISIGAPLVLRPQTGGGVVPEALSAPLAAAGLAIVIAGKLSLGRSFGLLPAHRGLVEAGLYRLVRHPIYLGYLVTHMAFLAAHPTVWNMTALVAADVTLVVRAIYEERTLARDPAYARYCQAVRWRLLPGVY